MIWEPLRKCCSPMRQRLVVAFMVLTGITFQYVHRLCFNLALTEITVKQEVTDDSVEDICKYNDTVESEEEHNRLAEFNWDVQQQALLLGVFYGGYIITHLPGGLLADLYGPKRVLGYGVLLSAICSLLTPASARVDIYVLVGIRALMGIAQGPMFPAVSVFIARWSLPHERNIMSSFMNIGVILGAILGNALTGFFLYNFSTWDTVFYVYTVATVVWYVFWIIFSHDSATKHPFISEKERTLINETLKDEMRHGKMKVPYCAILKSVPVWAMVIGGCGHDWSFYIVVSLLPSYMSYVLQFNVKDNGFLNCLPYIAMAIISLCAAKIAEIIISKGWMSKSIQCKVWFVLANQIPCVCFILASYAGCDRTIVVALFTLAMGTMGMIYSCVRVVQVDLSPNFAGILMAMMNGLGCICGFLGPKLFAVFTEEQTVKAWRTAFFISTGIISFTTIVFLIFGTSKLQPWNTPPGSDPAGTQANEADTGTDQEKSV